MSEPKLLTCVGLTHDLPLLPHFLRHYHELGVRPENMHVILNTPNPDDGAIAEARAILDAAGTALPKLWIAPYTSDSMWAQRRALQQEVARPEDWVLSADVDEFHEYPTSLPKFLDWCAARDIDCVHGPFIDRLSGDGALNPVQPQPSLWEQFPLRGDVACSVRRNEGKDYWHGTVKLMVMRGRLLPKRGGHQPQAPREEVNFLYGRPLATLRGITRAPVRFSIPLRVHHFKWTAALQGSVQRRLETPGASEAGSRYGRRLLEYLGGEDRIPIERIPLMRFDPLGPLPWQLRLALMRRLLKPAKT